MKYEVIEIKEKIIVGVKSKEKSFNNSSNLSNTVTYCWNEFMPNYENIKNKINDKILCMYFDFEEYKNNDTNYSVMVGCECSNSESNLQTENVSGKYAKFKIKGSVQDIIKFWRDLNEDKFEIERRFTHDFEEYKLSDLNDFNNLEINIYVSIK